MWRMEIWDFVVNGSEEKEGGGTGNNGLRRMGFSVFEVIVVGHGEREKLEGDWFFFIVFGSIKKGKVSILITFIDARKTIKESEKLIRFCGYANETDDII